VRRAPAPPGFAFVRVAPNPSTSVTIPVHMLQILLITTVLAARPVAISLDRVQFRWDFANIVAAAVLLSVATIALTVFFFRRTARDKTLLYFGLFTSLYSVRLLIPLASFRAMVYDAPAFWVYLNWYITAVIIIPLNLFLYQLADADLRKFLRWILAGEVAFAVFGITAAAVGTPLAPLFTANNITIFIALTLLGVYLVSRRRHFRASTRTNREFRVFAAGYLVWMLFVVQTNLPGRPLTGGRNVEFVGFLIFVACLGYVTVLRTYANEQQLLAIGKELEIARRIQFSTLPQSVPILSDLETAARYVPMSAVAGDFYDFLVVDEKHLGVLVADVTGHGVPAALIASMLKVAFAGQAGHAENPAAVLTGLNRALCGKFEEHFVTAAYLFVDLQSQRLAYAGAGHPPLLMLTRDSSQTEEIEQNGLMLGLFPEAEYSGIELDFSPGDRVLLYTDGIVEASNPAREEYNKSRCREFLQTHRHLNPPELVDALLEEVSRFAGYSSARAQEDDITLLVLDFRAPAKVPATIDTFDTLQ
jgi:phosphoserine phosphatase RsbU/P